MAKKYNLDVAEYRNYQRNKERIVKLAEIIDQAHRITRQVKAKRIKGTASLKTK